MKKSFYAELPRKSRRVILLAGIFYFLLVMLTLVMARLAMAAEPLQTVPRDAMYDGGLFFITPVPTRLAPAPLVSTEVEIDVSGPVARVKVLQTFKNPTHVWLEGIYTFPLPEKSAVDRLTMIIGERTVKGVIQEKEQAQKTYDAAKAAGKKASLVTQERPNIFTNAVANIGPGETVAIEIEYQDSARFLDGAFSLRFPMVVRPRYIPGDPSPMMPSGTGWSYDTNQVPDGSRITPPIADPRAGPINPVGISVRLDPGFTADEITSPSHDIKVAEKRDHYRITLTEGTVPADSDFVLAWRPAPGGTPLAGSFTEKIDGDYYHLFMVIPRKETGAQEQAVLPREVIFIIDVSGSMGGEAIRQAKAALLKALGGLKTEDRFNIIAFNDSAHPFYPGPVRASARRVDEAREAVSRLQAGGGTEMAGALNLALTGGTGLEYLRQIIFMTDGAVGNEDYLFRMIHERLGDSRLFTVGIGSAPNSYFMREAAAMGKGTFTYIGDLGEVDEKITALFRKIETPVLKDIAIALPGGAEMFPARVPDLYDGEPVVISVRTENKLKGDVIFSGQIADADWRQRVTVGGGKNAGVGALWAREKIRAITNEAIRAGAGYAEETRLAIVDVALRHQLVSKYTSLVAVDEEISRKDADLKTGTVPTNLPKDMDPAFVTGGSVFAYDAATQEALAAQGPAAFASAEPLRRTGQIRLPQTATGLWRSIFVGLISFLSAIFLLLLTRKKAAECRF